MRKSMKITLITGLVLFVLGGLGSFITERQHIADIKKRTVENHTTIKDDVHTIKINVYGAKRVKVKRGDHLQINAREIPGDYEVKHQVEDGVLKIEDRIKDLTGDNPNINFHLSNTYGNNEIELIIPKDIKIITGRTTNYVDVSFDKVDLDRLSIDTEAGNIDVKDSVVKQAKAISSTGDIILSHNAFEGLTAQNNDGDVLIKDLPADIPIDVENMSGLIDIEWRSKPENSTIEYHTTSGELEVDKNIISDDIVGKGKNEVRIVSKDGDINLH